MSFSAALRALEESQQLEVEKALVLTNQGRVVSRQEKTEKFTRGQVTSADLSQSVVAVCGVLLPRVVPTQGEQVFTCNLLYRKKNPLLIFHVWFGCLPVLAAKPFGFGAGGLNLPQSEKTSPGFGLPKACATRGPDWLWQNLSG